MRAIRRGLAPDATPQQVRRASELAHAYPGARERAAIPTRRERREGRLFEQYARAQLPGTFDQPATGLELAKERIRTPLRAGRAARPEHIPDDWWVEPQAQALVKSEQESGYLPEKAPLGYQISRQVALNALLFAPGVGPGLRGARTLKAALALGKRAAAGKAAERAVESVPTIVRGGARAVPRAGRVAKGREIMRSASSLRRIRRQAVPLSTRAGKLAIGAGPHGPSIAQGTGQALAHDRETVIKRTPAAALGSVAGLGTIVAAPFAAAAQGSLEPIAQMLQEQGASAKELAGFFSGDPKTVETLTRKYGLAPLLTASIPAAVGLAKLKPVRRAAARVRGVPRTSQRRRGSIPGISAIGMRVIRGDEEGPHHVAQRRLADAESHKRVLEGELRDYEHAVSGRPKKAGAGRYQLGPYEITKTSKGHWRVRHHSGDTDEEIGMEIRKLDTATAVVRAHAKEQRDLIAGGDLPSHEQYLTGLRDAVAKVEDRRKPRPGPRDTQRRVPGETRDTPAVPVSERSEAWKTGFADASAGRVRDDLSDVPDYAKGQAAFAASKDELRAAHAERKGEQLRIGEEPQPIVEPPRDRIARLEREHADARKRADDAFKANMEGRNRSPASVRRLENKADDLEHALEVARMEVERLPDEQLRIGGEPEPIVEPPPSGRHEQDRLFEPPDAGVPGQQSMDLGVISREEAAAKTERLQHRVGRVERAIRDREQKLRELEAEGGTLHDYDYNKPDTWEGSWDHVARMEQEIDQLDADLQNLRGAQGWDRLKGEIRGAKELDQEASDFLGSAAVGRMDPAEVSRFDQRFRELADREARNDAEFEQLKKEITQAGKDGRIPLAEDDPLMVALDENLGESIALTAEREAIERHIDAFTRDVGDVPDFVGEQVVSSLDALDRGESAPIWRWTEKKLARMRGSERYSTAEARLEARVKQSLDTYIKKLRKIPKQWRDVVPLLAGGTISLTNRSLARAQIEARLARLEKLHDERPELRAPDVTTDDLALLRRLAMHPEIIFDDRVLATVAERGRLDTMRTPTTIDPQRAFSARAQEQAIVYDVPTTGRRVAGTAGELAKEAAEKRTKAHQERGAAGRERARAGERRRMLEDRVRLEEKLRGQQRKGAKPKKEKQPKLEPVPTRELTPMEQLKQGRGTVTIGRRLSKEERKTSGTARSKTTKLRITDDPGADLDRFIGGGVDAPPKSRAERARKLREKGKKTRALQVEMGGTRKGNIATGSSRWEQSARQLEEEWAEGNREPHMQAYAWLSARSRLAHEMEQHIPKDDPRYQALLDGDTSQEIHDFAVELLEAYEARDADVALEPTVTPFDEPTDLPAGVKPEARKPGPPDVDTEPMVVTEAKKGNGGKQPESMQEWVGALHYKPPARVVRLAQSVDRLYASARTRTARAEALEAEAKLLKKEAKRVGRLVRPGAERWDAPEVRAAHAAFEQEIFSLRKAMQLPEPQYVRALNAANLTYEVGNNVLKREYAAYTPGRDARRSGTLIRTGQIDRRWEADAAESMVRPIRQDELNRMIRNFFEEEALEYSGNLAHSHGEAHAIIKAARRDFKGRPEVVALNRVEFERAFDGHNGSDIVHALDRQIDPDSGDSFLADTKAEYVIVDREAFRELRAQLDRQSEGIGAALKFNRIQAYAVLGTSPGWLLSQFPATLLPALLSVGPINLMKAVWRYHQMPEDLRVGYEAMAEAPHGFGMAAVDSVHGLRRGIVQLEIDALRAMGRGGFWRALPQIPQIIRSIERYYTTGIRKVAVAGQIEKELARSRNALYRSGANLSKNSQRFYDEAHTALKAMDGKDVWEQRRYFIDNPEAAARIQKYIREMLGDWRSLTRYERYAAGLGFFYPFLRWSLRFTWRHFPMHHPVKATILSYLGLSNTSELARLLGTYPGWTQTLMQMVIHNGPSPSQGTLLSLSRIAPGGNALVEAGSTGFNGQSLRLMQPAFTAAVEGALGYDVTKQRPLTDESTQVNPFTGQLSRELPSGDISHDSPFWLRAGGAMNELLRLSPLVRPFAGGLGQQQGFTPQEDTLWSKALPSDAQRFRESMLGTQIMPVKRTRTLELLRRYTDIRAFVPNPSRRSHFKHMPPGKEKEKMRKELTRRIERAKAADEALGRMDPKLRWPVTAQRAFFAPLGGSKKKKRRASAVPSWSGSKTSGAHDWDSSGSSGSSGNGGTGW